MSAFRIFCALMAVGFLGVAGMRVMDPAPLLWVMIYGLVAVMSGLSVARKLPHRPAFGLVAVLGLFLWLFVDLGRPFDLDDPVVRDELGLGVAFGWTLILAVVAQRVSARRLIEGD